MVAAHPSADLTLAEAAQQAQAQQGRAPGSVPAALQRPAQTLAWPPVLCQGRAGHFRAGQGWAGQGGAAGRTLAMSRSNSRWMRS